MEFLYIIMVMLSTVGSPTNSTNNVDIGDPSKPMYGGTIENSN